MPAYYPVFLNIEGKKCVVVGGGEVAERKVKALLDHGAGIVVISPSITQELHRLKEEGAIKVCPRDFRPGDLKDAVLVIAATDSPQVNTLVSHEGQAERILVNVVDNPADSNFIVPSLLRRGELSIAISTGGRSPALARKIRTELERKFPPEYASLTSLLAEVRQELKSRGKQVAAEAWQKYIDIDLLIGMLKQNRFGEARSRMLCALAGEEGPKKGIV